MTSDMVSRNSGERLGGRWAISVRGYLWALAIALIGISADVQRMGYPNGLLFLTVTLAVFGLNGAIDVVLHRTRWSQRCVTPVPAIEVFARLTFSGLCLATAYGLLRTERGIDMPLGIAQGFILYPAISVWVASTLIICLDVLDQARRIRVQSIEERARARDIVHRADATTNRVRERVDAVLAPEIDRLRNVVSSQQHEVVSSEIRSVVDESVRGVGRQLWRGAEGTVGRISLLEVIRGLVLHPKLRPWPMIGLGIVIPLFEQGQKVDTRTVLVAVVATGVVLLECWLANNFMSHHPGSRSVVVALIVCVFTAQTLLVDQLGEQWGQSPDDPGIVVVFLFTLSLIAVTSALGSYRELNDERAHVIASEIAAERLDAEAHAHAVSEETRRLAALLHGRIQSRLLGCAMAIEFAGDDPDALRVALNRTVEVLNDGWAENGIPLVLELSEIVKPWSGLVDIRLEIARDADNAITSDVAVVVEELLANAVRHGNATHVNVEIDVIDDDVIVAVRDNGAGGDVNRSGLGSQLLSRLGTVERMPTTDGWNVVVRVPQHSG